MRTLGWARDGGPRRHFDATTRDVDGVLADCDVLVSALPSTAATRGLLGGGRLVACGRSPLFLNVGRAALTSFLSWPVCPKPELCTNEI